MIYRTNREADLFNDKQNEFHRIYEGSNLSTKFA